MPFITEEIWQKVKPLAGVNGDTIMLAPFPLADAGAEDLPAVREIDWVKQCILGIRRIKGEMNIPPGKPLPVLVANASEQDQLWLKTARPYLDFLARTESITILTNETDAPEAAMALVGTMKLLIPMAGLIDKDAELKRLDKELARLTDDNARIEQKLANASFVDKAPAAVVAKERERLAENAAAIGNLLAQRDKIAAL